MSTLKPMLLGNLKRAILGFGIRKLPLIAGHKLFTNVISDVGCAILEEEGWEVAILRRSVNAFKRSGVPFMGFEEGGTIT